MQRAMTAEAEFRAHSSRSKILSLAVQRSAALPAALVRN
jgi:hypothetical protein